LMSSSCGAPVHLMQGDMGAKGNTGASGINGDKGNTV
jgi:hypothetical protein